MKTNYNLGVYYDEKVVVVTGRSGYIGSALINKIEKRNFVGSVELLKSLSGWSPSISLEEGIKFLVNHNAKEYINDSVS